MPVAQSTPVEEGLAISHRRKGGRAPRARMQFAGRVVPKSQTKAERRRPTLASALRGCIRFGYVRMSPITVPEARFESVKDCEMGLDKRGQSSYNSKETKVVRRLTIREGK